MLHEVDVQALDPERLEKLVGPERAARFESSAAAARALLEGRRVVNVNSTATGGGVAELLQTLLAYVRGVGVDARWVVIEGDAEFFDDHEADPQPPLRLARRRWTSGFRGARSTTSRRCIGTPPSCSRSSVPATSSSCTTRRRPAWSLPRRRGRAGRLALPCRPRHAEPRHGAGLGVPPPATSSRSTRSCSPGPSSRPSWIDRYAAPRDHAVDRSVLRQERAADTGGGAGDPPVRRAARRRR